MIEQQGGKNIGSISSKTSFILAGENMGPSKLAKAEKLGIRIVYEEDFLKMIGGVASKNETHESVSVVESHHAEPVQLSLFE